MTDSTDGNGAEEPKRTELPATEIDLDPAGDGTRQIGPYRLLQLLGEGGMGEVWLAEQNVPIRRRVALKIIKQGMDTKQVIARFEAERQALAIMDHPSVAKVFDAGSTKQGRPYFVMEHVQGAPITDYCDRHKLSNRERLTLFVQVCDGVQHAHQKAIIHRDLKPSNVLVTEQDGKAVPKIIDFGVAKATSQRLTERTMFTELGVLIGTPEYMSPEQADLTGEDIDTRTDVYALGVMLYELLVGVLPFDPKELRSAGFEGIRRKIREVDPKRPSTRFSTLGDKSVESARNRRADRSTLLRQLRGDLDWITMKALEKDRTRRYGSSADLAADIVRHLGDEPVQARSPSTAYRVRKFVRRHRFGVAAAAVLGVALVAGIVGTTIGLVRARRAETVARTEQRRSARVASFLSDTLEGVNPTSMGATLRTMLTEAIGKGQPPSHPGELSLEGVNMVDVARHLVDAEILSPAVKRIDAELREEPALAADLLHTAGSTYANLQLYDPAAEVLSRAAALSERTHGAGDELTLRLKGAIADTYRRSGRYRDAEAIYRETLETARRTLGEEAKVTLVTMNYLGDALRYQGRADEAEPLLRQALEKMKRTLGPEDHETLETSNNLALVVRDQRHYEEAEKLLRATADGMKRTVGIENPETLNAQSNLANVLLLSGRPTEAEALLNDILDKSRRVLGDEVYLTLIMRKRLAEVYLAEKRFDECETLIRDNLQKMRRTLGEDHPETVGSLRALAIVLSARGRVAESVPLLLDARDRFRRIFGEGHVRTLTVANDLASAYEHLGRRGEAEAMFLATAHALAQSRPAALDPVYAEATYHLACLDAARGDRSKALERLKASLDAGFSSPDRIASSSDLASLRGPELDALLARTRRK